MAIQKALASGPSVWTGAEYADRTDWIYYFTDAAIADIDRAITAVRQKGLQLDDITAEDFNLPALADNLKNMADILGAGRGFVMLKGLSIEKYSDEEFEIILYGIGTHIGTGVSQSHLGDRIGQVKNVGGVGRYYTAGGAIEVHMDPVDVTGLLCLRAAKSGGESWIMSAATARNILQLESPEHFEILFDGLYYGMTQSGPENFKTKHRVPVFADLATGPVCFYLPAAIAGWAERSPEHLSGTELAALDHLNEIALRDGIHLKMDLQPGDIQFLNNRTLLHARTDYEDYEDKKLARHLLRLWLMVPQWPALPENMGFLKQSDRAGGGIPKGGQSVVADSSPSR